MVINEFGKSIHGCVLFSGVIGHEEKRVHSREFVFIRACGPLIGELEQIMTLKAILPPFDVAVILNYYSLGYIF